jgi:REP element-mobilizing transposase RayT
MANTYTQITIQLIFAVKNRNALIVDSFREELHKYIGGIIRNQDQKLLAINSVPDHIHILIGQTPTITLADLMREIKSESSRFINENKLSRYKFNWQEGYGAFSYSRSQRDRVIKYILNQQNHHQKITFRKEYLGFLEKFEVDYDPRYLFEYFD